MKFIKNFFKGNTEVVKQEDKGKQISRMLDLISKEDPAKIVGMAVCVVKETGEVDAEGKMIVDLDTKLVGDPYTLIGISKGLNESLLYLLAEEAQAKTLSNLEGITKH